jgi:hypothetical protein
MQREKVKFSFKIDLNTLFQVRRASERYETQRHINPWATKQNQSYGHHSQKSIVKLSINVLNQAVKQIVNERKYVLKAQNYRVIERKYVNARANETQTVLGHWRKGWTLTNQWTITRETQVFK